MASFILCFDDTNLCSSELERQQKVILCKKRDQDQNVKKQQERNINSQRYYENTKFHPQTKHHYDFQGSFGKVCFSEKQMHNRFNELLNTNIAVKVIDVEDQGEKILLQQEISAMVYFANEIDFVKILPQMCYIHENLQSIIITKKYGRNETRVAYQMLQYATTFKELGLKLSKERSLLKSQIQESTDTNKKTKLLQQKAQIEIQMLLIFIQISLALRRMHQVLVAHFDIKEENIYFDESLNPYLADLGLTSYYEDETFMSSEFLGTLFYMGYEYGKNHKRDYFHRNDQADLFAFGVVMTNVIYGRKSKDIDDGFVRQSDLKKYESDDLFENLINPIIERLLTEFSVFQNQEDKQEYESQHKFFGFEFQRILSTNTTISSIQYKIEKRGTSLQLAEDLIRIMNKLINTNDQYKSAFSQIIQKQWNSLNSKKGMSDDLYDEKLLSLKQRLDFIVNYKEQNERSILEQKLWDQKIQYYTDMNVTYEKDPFRIDYFNNTRKIVNKQYKKSPPQFDIELQSIFDKLHLIYNDKHKQLFYKLMLNNKKFTKEHSSQQYKKISKFKNKIKKINFKKTNSLKLKNLQNNQSIVNSSMKKLNTFPNEVLKEEQLDYDSDKKETYYTSDKSKSNSGNRVSSIDSDLQESGEIKKNPLILQKVQIPNLDNIKKQKSPQTSRNRSSISKQSEQSTNKQNSIFLKDLNLKSNKFLRENIRNFFSKNKPISKHSFINSPYQSSREPLSYNQSQSSSDQNKLSNKEKAIKVFRKKEIQSFKNPKIETELNLDMQDSQIQTRNRAYSQEEENYENRLTDVIDGSKKQRFNRLRRQSIKAKLGQPRPQSKSIKVQQKPIVSKDFLLSSRKIDDQKLPKKQLQKSQEQTIQPLTFRQRMKRNSFKKNKEQNNSILIPNQFNRVNLFLQLIILNYIKSKFIYTMINAQVDSLYFANQKVKDSLHQWVKFFEIVFFLLKNFQFLKLKKFLQKVSLHLDNNFKLKLILKFFKRQNF